MRMTGHLEMRSYFVRNTCSNMSPILGKRNSFDHLHSVTVKHISDVTKKLKSCQKDENTHLISDCFLYGSPRLFVTLALLYTTIRHGFSNYAFNHTTRKPIIKDKMKSNTTSDNYRGTAPIRS